MISLNKQTKSNVTIIDFLDQFDEKMGQLAYTIIGNKAVIHDTYLYPDYRNKGILKSQFPYIISMIKSNANILELSVLNEEAKTIWIKLGFIEIRPNILIMNL